MFKEPEVRERRGIMYTPKIDMVAKADVLIIGGGLAGTWAGIGAKDEGAEDVLLVDKG